MDYRQGSSSPQSMQNILAQNHFSETGDAAVLELIYLYGTSGLNVVYDLVPAHRAAPQRSFFAGRWAFGRSGCLLCYGNIGQWPVNPGKQTLAFYHTNLQQARWLISILLTYLGTYFSWATAPYLNSTLCDLKYPIGISLEHQFYYHQFYSSTSQFSSGVLSSTGDTVLRALQNQLQPDPKRKC